MVVGSSDSSEALMSQVIEVPFAQVSVVLVYTSVLSVPGQVLLNLAANYLQCAIVWSYASTVAIVIAKIKFLIFNIKLINKGFKLIHNKNTILLTRRNSLIKTGRRNSRL